MFEELFFLFKEYLWIFAAVACVMFKSDCEKNRRFLTTPSDYFAWGIATVFIMQLCQRIPMG